MPIASQSDQVRRPDLSKAHPALHLTTLPRQAVLYCKDSSSKPFRVVDTIDYIKISKKALHMKRNIHLIIVKYPGQVAPSKNPIKNRRPYT